MRIAELVDRGGARARPARRASAEQAQVRRERLGQVRLHGAGGGAARRRRLRRARLAGRRKFSDADTAPGKRARAATPQPHLEANMARYRELIGVPHRYWNRAMPREAQWSVIIIDVLPPDRGQLRIRLVAEARQTAQDGSGTGAVIGPSIRLTPLLVELEKLTKAANPPRYYRDRPETTRKACDQLTVDGRRSEWFLKRYLQGQDLLLLDMMPSRASDFVPSFNKEQIDAAIEASRSKRGGKNRRARAVAPPEAGCRAVRQCRACAEPFISFNVGCAKDVSRSGIGISTGVACSQCGLALCGTCVFAHLSRQVDISACVSEPRSIYALAATSRAPPCDHRHDAPPHAVLESLWFASPERLTAEPCARPYIQAHGGKPTIRYAALEHDVVIAEEERYVYKTWLACFTTTAVHRCHACSAVALVPLQWAGSGDQRCMSCGTAACPRCAGPAPCSCGFARLAVGGALGPAAAAYTMETALHAAHSHSMPAADIVGAVRGQMPPDIIRAITRLASSSPLIASSERAAARLRDVAAALDGPGAHGVV